MQPLVFVLDLDGTIVGDVKNQVLLYELKSANVNIVYNIQKSFDAGLIRPYFDVFVKNTKNRLPNAEFFIYTASEDRWANTIVTAIEKHISFKFNRPIFSRRHCVHMRKNLNMILPSIKRTLRKNYPNLRLENRIMIVDNNEVYDDPKELVLCKTYDKCCIENIPSLIKEDIFIRHQSVITNIMRRFYDLGSFTNYIEFQKVFYAVYIRELDDTPQQDRFWMLLGKLLEVKNIHKFTPEAIAYINKKLEKHSTMQ